MQTEITKAIPLLDSAGNLTQAGYAKKLLPIYRRSQVKGGLTRLKEWDYYLVGNDHFALALTIADNSYMGLDSISFLDFDQGWQITRSPMRPFPMGRTGLPETSETGNVASAGKGYAILFRNEGGRRQLTAHMDKFRRGESLEADVTLGEPPEESMVICTPFDKPGHFYYNQKINCLPAAGTVTIGKRVYDFGAEPSFAVLDWGRGVWTYHNTWYWGSASGLVDGEPFGFNLGYGFGNTSAATENMLFYRGKAHKLERVTFHIPGDGTKSPRFLEPWRFTSSDGRFTCAFQPVLDRASCTNAGVIKSDQHQVFGRFTGTAVLDGGQVIRLKDFMGFAEKVENRW